MTHEYDAIIIGSGFGGALAAHPLVHAGWRVLMIERGGWLARGPENWQAEAVRDLSAQYDCSTPYSVAGDDPSPRWKRTRRSSFRINHVANLPASR
jgi:choline dehydrogenase-like flavoprotein